MGTLEKHIFAIFSLISVFSFLSPVFANEEHEAKKRKIALEMYDQFYTEIKVLEMVDDLYDGFMKNPEIDQKAKNLVGNDKGNFAYYVDVSAYSYSICAGDILYSIPEGSPEVQSYLSEIHECHSKKFSYFQQMTRIAKYATNFQDPHISSCWLKNRKLQDEIEFPIKPALWKLLGDQPDPIVSWRVDYQKLIECIQQ